VNSLFLLVFDAVGQKIDTKILHRYFIMYGILNFSLSLRDCLSKYRGRQHTLRIMEKIYRPQVVQQSHFRSHTFSLSS